MVNNLTGIILVFALCSCSSYLKDKYLDNLNTFVTEIESNSTTDWEQADAEFEQLTKIEYEEHKKNFTKKDKKEFGKLCGRYSVVRAKGYGNQLKNALEDGKDFIEGFVEGLMESNTEQPENTD
jgi:hypothetical protein